MIMIILLGFSGVEWCWMGWEMEFYDVLWCLDSVGFCGVEQGYKWWEGSPKIPWRRNHDLLALLSWPNMESITFGWLGWAECRDEEDTQLTILSIVFLSPPARWGSLDFISWTPDVSGHCRTSAASSRSLRSGACGWGPAVPMSERMSEEMPDTGEFQNWTSDRMPEWMPDTMAE